LYKKNSNVKHNQVIINYEKKKKAYSNMPKAARTTALGPLTLTLAHPLLTSPNTDNNANVIRAQVTNRG